MPLVAFMKDSDPNRISSITPDEADRNRARRLVPARESVPGTKVYAKLIVADCISHIGGVSIPVELRRRGPKKEWVSAGIARVCPLCWLVLVGPDGTKEPEVKPLEHTGTHRDVKPRPPRRTKTQEPPVVEEIQLDRLNFPSLKKWMPDGKWFDLYQVMEEYNISRPTASEVMGQLRRMGLVEAIPGRGRGNRTKFRIAQKKEA